jgi:tetratricopeptide (TPR) repeat protein
MLWDFNVLEKKAKQLIDAGRPQDAIRIYFMMADGDPSLDGGYLGEKIGRCYEQMGQLYAAKFWYGRAVEENPEVRLDSAKARERLEKVVNIDDLILPKEYVRNAV